MSKCCWGYAECDCWRDGCGDCHECHCMRADCDECNTFAPALADDDG